MKNQWSIAGTRNCIDFLEIGSETLNNGGSAIDAVETVIKEVELNPNDLSVGFNGFPNLLGEVELDASIMVGSNRKIGAVAGIKNFVHAISIARKVMELTPHALLVGHGAERFAKATGFQERKLLDSNILEMYNNVLSGKEMLDGVQIPEQLQNVAWRYDKFLKKQLKEFDYKGWYAKLKNFHGTVNVIAKDQTGEMCSGVSTSGLALKFPGRAGDSPLIGAGNYCDNRYGGAACVGVGELAIRLGLARITVAQMESKSVTESVINGIKDLLSLNEKGVIQILAMDKEGNVSACANDKLHFVHANSENSKIQKIDSQLLQY